MGYFGHFGLFDVLGGKVCIEKRVALLTIMSYSKRNVEKLLIRLDVLCY